MGEILIFAGTTEGRKLSECLAHAGVRHTICVATEYGEIVLKNHPMAKVHQGRMDLEEIKEFLLAGDFSAVVDATHPYAEIITRNVKAAAKETAIPYLRLKRELYAPDGSRQSEINNLCRQNMDDGGSRVIHFETNEACARALERTEGNILLTTGSKELAQYCISENVKNRLYVRILPSVESLSLCEAQGICGKQVIAMQGPFTAEMNEAIIRQYQISCLVTKESGASGGYPEKLASAAKTGVRVFIIGHPQEEEGYTIPEICNKLENFCQKRLSSYAKLEIILAGAGMGNPACLTKEVQEAIDKADILLGAERIIAQYHPRLEMRPFYQAEQIIPYLREIQEKNLFAEKGRVVILFSGDSGFYSGCRLVYDALQKEVQRGRLKASLSIMPGISSVAFLAAQIGESYQDAAVCSIHGKAPGNLAGKIKNNSGTFLLMSGAKDVNELGKLLLEAGMASCEIMAGYQLSYKEQKILRLTPQECCGVKEEGLYTCFVSNPDAAGRSVAPGIRDTAFHRGQAPMTKEEVREASICKLQLHSRAVVYDIGSGSGSVAVEIAALSDDIQVYAIEKKKEALSLIEQNREKFGLQNISVIEAVAPESLSDLPMATHAFIGGSGGKMKEILTSLYRSNPSMRIVINAVSMETICEIKEILSSYSIRETEIVQLQASRIREVGNYHLMQAENPVWIFAFRFEDK